MYRVMLEEGGVRAVKGGCREGVGRGCRETEGVGGGGGWRGARLEFLGFSMVEKTPDCSQLLEEILVPQPLEP